MLAFTAVNAWVIYKDLYRHCRKPYHDILVELAEELIQRGERRSNVKRCSGTERPSKRASLMKILKHTFHITVVPEEGVAIAEKQETKKEQS